MTKDMDLDSFIEALLETEKPKQTFPYSIYFTEGVKYLNLGLHQTALGYLDQAVESDKSSVKCLLKRSKCHLGLRDYERAIEDAEEVLRLRPGNAEALDLKGQAQYMHGDFEGGYLTYMNARKKNLFDPRFRLGKQLCREALENCFGRDCGEMTMGRDDVIGTTAAQRDDKTFDRRLGVLKSRRDCFRKDKKFLRELLKDRNLASVHGFCTEALDYINGSERFWTMERPLHTREGARRTFRADNSVGQDDRNTDQHNKKTEQCKKICRDNEADLENYKTDQDNKKRGQYNKTDQYNNKTGQTEQDNNKTDPTKQDNKTDQTKQDNKTDQDNKKTAMI